MTEQTIPGIKKEYIVKLTQDENGKVTLSRYNDGFNILEMIGMLQMSILELQQTWQGNLKPDVIERKVVKP